MNKFFEYNNVTGNVQLNGPDILLVEEFKALMEPSRNKCKEDPTGKEHLRAFREFQYIYLAIHWQSPYADFSNLERHEAALRDAKITEEEFNNPEFREACRKFRSLQDSNKSLRLLIAARETVDKLVDYFNNLDVEERDPETGKPIFAVKNVIAEITSLNKVQESLSILEMQVKKEIEAQSSLRGGFTDGYTPKF